MAKTYEAVVGLNYITAKGEVRVEAGTRIDDLPAKSAAWLLDQGLIAPVATKTTKGGEG